MDISKCGLITRKINNIYQYQWVDENYQLIPDIVPKKRLITDVDFSKFPSNVFDNIELFLGKGYFFNSIDEWLYNVKLYHNIDNCRFNLESEFGILLKNLTLNK